MTNKEAIRILTEMPISAMSDMTYEEIFDALNLAIKALENEPKKGKWIRITKNTANTQIWSCSECGRTVERNFTELDPDIFFPFCHCGADIREADNG